MRRLGRVLGLLILAACQDSPFATPPNVQQGPFASGAPIRLTYNPGTDTRAVWLPDGSGILYSEQRPDRPDGDECLALMGASGGSITREICPLGDPYGDSVNVLESPGLSPAGHLAYVRTVTEIVTGRGVVAPSEVTLVLASWSQPLQASVLVRYPYFASWGRVDMVSDLHWVGPSALVFAAQQVSYLTGVPVRSGINIERIDLRPSGSVLSVIPNTDSVESLSSDAPDTLFYLFQGDSAVHRRALTTGADTILYTFPAPATELTIAGTRYAAVIGAGVRVWDGTTGLDTTLAIVGSQLHRPALSPDGRRIVVEVSAVNPSTLAEGPPDLWLWLLP